MPFFSASGNSQSDSSSLSTQTSVAPIPTTTSKASTHNASNPSTASSSPSFFTSAFGSFFGSSPNPNDSFQLSHPNHPIRRTKSLSRSQYTPPITADEAMNLSRAIPHPHGHTTSPCSSGPRDSIDENDGLGHYQYSKYHDGGPLSPVLSSGSDSMPFGDSNPKATNTVPSNDTIQSSLPKTSFFRRFSTPSTHEQLNHDDALVNASQLNQKFETDSSSFDTISKSDVDHSLHSSSKTTPRRFSFSTTTTSNRLRRHSNSGAKYQGIGLVAAYDQGGIFN